MTVPARDEGLHRALAAGVPADVVAGLAAGRRRWLEQNEAGHVVEQDLGEVEQLLAGLFWANVDEALAHPLAPAYDEVFVAAMRRQRGIRGG